MCKQIFKHNSWDVYIYIQVRGLLLNCLSECRASVAKLLEYAVVLMILFAGNVLYGSSVLVLLCLYVDGFICDVCLVIICFPSLLPSVHRESCAS